MKFRVISDYCRGHKAFLVILGLGLFARLAVLLVYLSTHSWQGETWEYETLAINLLEGRGFTITHNEATYRSYIVPVFPLICAFLHVIGGPGLGLYYLFHLTIAAGIISMTYAIADHWYGAPTARMAALLVALEPGLIIYHSYKVDVIALSTFLLLLGAYVFALMADSWDRRLAILVGMIAGIGVLTRPDLVGFFALPVVWGVIERRYFRKVLQLVALTVFIAILVMTPWLARNYHIHGKLMLASITSESIWMGNNPNATGTPATLQIVPQFSAAPAEFQSKVLSVGEMEQGALFQEQAIGYIREAPQRFIWNALKKVYYFWWFTPTFSRQHYDWAPESLVVAYQFLYGALLGLFAYGSWFSIRKSANRTRHAAIYVMTLPMAIAILHTINYVEGRHRIMVMPMILILAAYGINVLAKRGKRPGDEYQTVFASQSQQPMAF